MRFIVFGTGAIGGTVAARLSSAGMAVVCIARGEHLTKMRRKGLILHTPEQIITVKPEFVEHPREILFCHDDIVLLCMKSQHTKAALQDLLLAAGKNIPVVCVQNGVANESMASKLFTRVYACVVVVPASYQKAGEVACYASGRSGILDIGLFSKHNTPADSSPDPILDELTAALEWAGFGSRATPAIMDWKYAKLTTNLGNIIQAAVQRPSTNNETDRKTWKDAFRTLTKQLHNEARSCFAAAGISFLTQKDINARCDEDAVNMQADIPGIERTGGSTLQSMLRDTGNIETDYLNGEIVKLGKRYDIPTPANAVMQDVGREIVAEKLGIGHFSIAEILQRIDPGVPAKS